MRRRVIILTELIAPYRIPVFNELALRSDIDLHVIFLSHTDSSIRQWRVYEDEIRFSYKVLPYWRKRIGKHNVLLNRGLVSELNASCPDVIICGGYNYLCSWQALRWAQRNHVPFLLWSESTGSDHRNRHSLVELLKRNFVASCNGFVVPGQSAREYLMQLGISVDQIFVAPNAVDTALFSRLQTEQTDLHARMRAHLGVPTRYFLFVGRLIRAKGVFDLLEAYAQLPVALRQQVGLVFAGDGPERGRLESLAREVCPGMVHFAGFVHREDLAAYYTLAECFVFPTHTDVWGLVMNEAMACGLPVICTRVAGCAPDLVQGNGRLIGARNISELIAAMEEIAMDPALRARMAHESRRLVQAFSPANCAAGLARASFAREAYV